ncbi:MAG: RHS repeat-associated core domain-containing protein [Chloroflexota bacterium]
MNTPSYSYTNEYSGDSTQLTYLRSRFYASSTGRFLTRDTWGGDANSPMSFNRWAYVIGNPINLTDPTGNNPGNYHKYCLPLAGGSLLACEKLLMGINPRSTIPYHELMLLDEAELDCLPLYESLRLPGQNGNTKSEDYGYWFHYLLEKTPGWWNKNGTDHASFESVAALSISREAGANSTIRTTRFPDLIVEAFVRKGWQVGFYTEIGSRQIVRQAVDEAIFFDNGYLSILANRDQRICKANGGGLQCGKNGTQSRVSFDVALSKFSARLATFTVSDIGLDTRMTSALGNVSYRSDSPTAPWEFGNPTTYTQSAFPNFFSALKSPLSGPGTVTTGEQQILYRDVSLSGDPKNGYYNQAFVLTKPQLRYWCGGRSCVAP